MTQHLFDIQLFVPRLNSHKPQTATAEGQKCRLGPALADSLSFAPIADGVRKGSFDQICYLQGLFDLSRTAARPSLRDASLFQRRQDPVTVLANYTKIGQRVAG